MKRHLIKYYYFVIAIFIGYLITIQIKANIIPYEGIVTIPKIIEIKGDIESVKKENQRLSKAINDANQKLEEYENGIKNNTGVLETMQQRLKAERANANYEKLEGPGIIILMNDSLEESTDDQYSSLYLIHDLDILNIVNDLRAAGAEAISVNNERIIATSNIRCGGPIIIIDGKRHAVPFVIKAIGNPQKLEEGIAIYRNLMEFYGIRINVEKADMLTINAYNGEYKLNYQKIAEDGE